MMIFIDHSSDEQRAQDSHIQLAYLKFGLFITTPFPFVKHWRLAPALPISDFPFLMLPLQSP